MELVPTAVIKSLALCIRCECDSEASGILDDAVSLALFLTSTGVPTEYD